MQCHYDHGNGRRAVCILLPDGGPNIIIDPSGSSFSFREEHPKQEDANDDNGGGGTGGGGTGSGGTGSGGTDNGSGIAIPPVPTTGGP
ncbi:hypothetical protein UA08_09064 [Talaromyces atroroseus]|uniref:Uncharacterized protein n=1 Tax=Talaromyces atroroseus TaxID=1441469 RepID=A0A1Q5Q6Z5_TALAT|nr:hypothetical protein UA08_09064 [Talaromyces atroroseus]OKL55617.1 hypothetical protein UA08_09064 [Talaromyces atroroseus]